MTVMVVSGREPPGRDQDPAVRPTAVGRQVGIEQGSTPTTTMVHGTSKRGIGGLLAVALASTTHARIHAQEPYNSPSSEALDYVNL